MNPEFGVGVRNYLFEDMTQIKKDLKERIRNQIRQYMPYIVLKNIKTTESSDNSVTVSIVYEVPKLGKEDIIVIDSKAGNNTGGPNFVV